MKEERRNLNDNIFNLFYNIIAMSELDIEIAFKEEGPEPEESTPPTPITTCDMEVIIRGWEEKFERISECLREVQAASERANSDMCLVSREARAQGEEQERRLETMHEGLKEFLQKFEPARPPNTPHVDAPTASTPYGIPARMRPEFGFQPSPVGQDEAMEPVHSTLPHIRSARTGDHEDIRETRMESARNTLPHIRSAHTGEHNIFRDAHTRDQDDIRDTRIREHDAFRDTRTRDQDDVRDTRTREHSDDRDARSRDLQYRLNERPTHEDDRGNSGDIQQNSYHSGNNSSMSRSSSSPKVPTFQPNSVPGSSSLRPSRAIKAGHSGNG